MRPTAGPISNLQRPVDEGGAVVVGRAEGAHDRGDRVGPGKERRGRRRRAEPCRARQSHHAAQPAVGVTILESTERRREGRVHRPVVNLRLVIGRHRQVRLVHR